MPDIKLLRPSAKIPTRSHHSDVGYDCYCCSDFTLPPQAVTLVPLGFAMGMDESQGVYAQLLSRSGLASKGVWVVGGVIDPGYRGEVTAALYNGVSTPFQIKAGDRVCQLAFYLFGSTTFSEVNVLPPSSRGVGGFGSTGGVLLS